MIADAFLSFYCRFFVCRCYICFHLSLHLLLINFVLLTSSAEIKKKQGISFEVCWLMLCFVEGLWDAVFK